MPLPISPMPDATDAESSVRAALRASQVTRVWADAELEPLVAGFNNRSWRMRWQGASYVVRLNRPESALLGVDRASELALVQAAASAGLAPPVVASDLGQGVLVLGYVAGRPWSAADAREPGNLRRLARAVARLHGLPHPRDVRTRSFLEQAERLERVCADAQLVLDARLAARARLMFARLAAADPAPALCHDDLHHLNIIDDGEHLVLIDWEYGGLGDPVFDLASIVAYHDLDAEARRPLLETYDRSDVIARLETAIWAFDYVQWLWYLAAAQSGDGPVAQCIARAAEIQARLTDRPRATSGGTYEN